MVQGWFFVKFWIRVADISREGRRIEILCELFAVGLKNKLYFVVLRDEYVAYILFLSNMSNTWLKFQLSRMKKWHMSDKD